MTNKRHTRRVEPDQDDQYSLPVCRSRNKQDEDKELGPDTKKLLDILRSLQDDDTGS